MLNDFRKVFEVSCEDFVVHLVVDSCLRDEDPSGRPCDNIFVISSSLLVRTLPVKLKQ